MSVHWGSASHRGRVRAINEDSLFVSPSVFVVADGMGGHAAGEVASGIVAAEFESLAERSYLRTDDLTDAVRRANEAVLAAAQDAGRAGMGTTLTGLAVVVAGGHPHWAVFNVGDSRTYRYAGDQLTQLSVDHSEVQELMASGSITAEQAATHPLRNVITRSMGSFPSPVPDLWVFPPVPGERFLLCSDGLTRELDDDRIRDVLHTHPDAQQAAATLVADAVEAGGRDNVTAIVVDLVGETAEGDDVGGDTAPRSAVGLV